MPEALARPSSCKAFRISNLSSKSEDSFKNTIKSIAEISFERSEKAIKKPADIGSLDGGYDAWLRVLGSFFIFFNSWGPLLAFGCFENFYNEYYLKTSTISDLSWIGTISVFLLLFGGVISGPAFDHGYYRWLLVGGSVFVIVGLMTLSLSRTYWEVLLSQGVCFGLGCGMLFIPSLAGVAVAFTSRRAIAIGISMSGASVGGVIYPIMLRQLIPTVGFPWAVRSIGFVAFATFLIAVPSLLREVPQSSGITRSLIDKTAITDVPFILFAIGGLFVTCAYYVPFLYIPQYAVSTGTSKSMSFYLLSITNASSFFGRIVSGLIADRLGAFKTLVYSQAASAIVLLCWLAVLDSTSIIVWTVFWGFFSGLLVSLPGAVMPSLCPTMGVVGTRMGMAWMLSALGSVIGGPICGVILRSGYFWPAQLYSGLCMVIGASCCAFSWYRLIKIKERSLSFV